LRGYRSVNRVLEATNRLTDQHPDLVTSEVGARADYIMTLFAKDEAGGGGCSVGGTSSAPLWLLLALGFLPVVRRRKRAR